MDPIVVVDAAVVTVGGRSSSRSWFRLDVVAIVMLCAWPTEVGVALGTGIGLGDEGIDVEADWTVDEVKTLVPELGSLSVPERLTVTVTVLLATGLPG